MVEETISNIGPGHRRRQRGGRGAAAPVPYVQPPAAPSSCRERKKLYVPTQPFPSTFTTFTE